MRCMGSADRCLRLWQITNHQELVTLVMQTLAIQYKYSGLMQGTQNIQNLYNYTTCYLTKHVAYCRRDWGWKQLCNLRLIPDMQSSQDAFIFSNALFLCRIKIRIINAGIPRPRESPSIVLIELSSPPSSSK